VSGAFCAAVMTPYSRCSDGPLALEPKKDMAPPCPVVLHLLMSLVCFLARPFRGVFTGTPSEGPEDLSDSLAVLAFVTPPAVLFVCPVRDLDVPRRRTFVRLGLLVIRTVPRRCPMPTPRYLLYTSCIGGVSRANLKPYFMYLLFSRFAPRFSSALFLRTPLSLQPLPEPVCLFFMTSCFVLP